ncbi:MAG: hypothetical protein JO027_15045 [Solirubrobacterales bacterium]|nr:hypothetical protein [Solirubrobacterales bacterium]
MSRRAFVIVLDACGVGALPDAAEGARRHDGGLADVGASVLAWLTGERAAPLPGDPFL